MIWTVIRSTHQAVSLKIKLENNKNNARYQFLTMAFHCSNHKHLRGLFPPSTQLKTHTVRNHYVWEATSSVLRWPPVEVSSETWWFLTVCFFKCVDDGESPPKYSWFEWINIMLCWRVELGKFGCQIIKYEKHFPRFFHMKLPHPGRSACMCVNKQILFKYLVSKIENYTIGTVKRKCSLFGSSHCVEFRKSVKVCVMTYSS
jgi:hypothetical protein